MFIFYTKCSKYEVTHLQDINYWQRIPGFSGKFPVNPVTLKPCLMGGGLMSRVRQSVLLTYKHCHVNACHNSDEPSGNLHSLFGYQTFF